MLDAKTETSLGLDLSAIVPGFATRVVYDGPARESFERALGHEGIPGRVVEHCPRPVGARPPTEIDEQGADCVLLVFSDARDVHTTHPLLDTLAPDGYALLVSVRTGDDPATDPLTLAELAAGAGLAIYSTQDRTLERSGLRATVMWAVPPDYNPVLHARALTRSGRPACALEVLNLIPDTLIADPNNRRNVTLEKLDTLLAWDRASGLHGRLHRFFHAEALFYDAVYRDPTGPAPYTCMAELWARIGDRDMAARLLRSLNHVSTQLTVPIEIRRRSSEGPDRKIVGPPALSENAASPTRVLLITHPRPHYGLDVLYDGLCEVLGDENVVEFPFKPALHGAPLSDQANYPCQFQRRGTPMPLETILSDLEEGRFDAVLYGDIEGHLDTPVAKRIAEFAKHIPICIVDAQDDPIDHRAEMARRLATDRFACYFKREMLSCWEYGPSTVPLPFAYSDGRLPRRLNETRTHDLFWAGHRQFGLRRLYLEHIESKFKIDLSRGFAQDEYSAALLRSRIGLSIFGFGFDTVRYWEVPAHGCMLLAERPPIRIPFNFREGESAVFFDDLPDLEEKLAHYLDHPDQAKAIACRGHEHLKRFHTGSARAAQVLSWLRHFAND